MDQPRQRRPRRTRTRTWTPAHAERLLWRAGFGGTPKEIAYWAARDRERTIDWLIRGGHGAHGAKRMVGPEPRVDGKPLGPRNEWGHDVLWWLDKMVRSQRPLVEKLTLFWHDHFATRDQDTPLMMEQNRTLRSGALGSFPKLLRAITLDPAMQAFLSLVDSDKESPNENYARELMELFTLGVKGGYTERDVREAARALTGFKGNWREGRPLTVSYDPERHDSGYKRLLGRRGRLTWGDVLSACVEHPSHAPFLVSKLWDFFVAEPLPKATGRRLARVYVGSGRRVAPVVEEILADRALYADLGRPQMVKWPIVQTAGMLRSIGRPVDTGSWVWIGSMMGQVPFNPPSVAGWDWGGAWMSTATMRARFLAATYVCNEEPVKVRENEVDVAWTAAEHVERARAATGRPWTSAATDQELLRMAQRFTTIGVRPDRGLQQHQADLTQAALRHLLLAGPDASLC
jgi:uncharacterized protein (DUF1800 family)